MLRFVSSIALPVVIAVIVALAATGNLFAFSPILIAIQLSSVCLAAWARRSFARGSFRVVATPAGEAILRRGPYRLMRHPMYSAALLFVWSGVLAHIAEWTVAVGVLVIFVVVLRIVIEERLLLERYGDYADYARTTKALIPFVV
jgi:protein-S-isoprenylcysteine O-methyltransferase